MDANDVELPFSDAVAARAKLPVGQVDAVLAKFGVEASSIPPPARPLSVLWVNFSGVKLLEGREAPFAFDWDTRGTGVRALISKSNFVGKTTILQLILWCLRGSPRDMTDVVRNWIRRVDVAFKAGQYQIRTTFECTLDSINGQVSVGFYGAEDVTRHAFSDQDQFRRLMEEHMMAALDFELIPASQQGSNGRVTAYNDGWAAYTSAFISDPKNEAIIGEKIGGADLTGRLLQVYVGMPWAYTLFRARSQKRVLESENQSRRRELSVLKGKSIADLEAEVQLIERQIKDQTLRDQIAADFERARTDYAELAEKVRTAEMLVDTARSDEKEAEAAHNRAQRAIHDLKEGHAASGFFGLLKPKCCPRCAALIQSDRLEAESKTHHCSVCTSEVPQLEDTHAADLSVAESREKEARNDHKTARKRLGDIELRQGADRRAFEAAGQRLGDLAKLGTAADVLALNERAQRIHGMLDVAREIEKASFVNEEDIAILTSAQDEAMARVDAASAKVLLAVSDEVKRLALLLGVVDVEAVAVKRNANVDVIKGGTKTSFGKLSAGERLRFRVAMVIALVRGAHENGVRRHPGLFLLDSPGAEEVAEGNLEDMLGELNRLTVEIPDFQLFIAMKSSSADPFGESDHIRRTEVGQMMW